MIKWLKQLFGNSQLSEWETRPDGNLKVLDEKSVESLLKLICDSYLELDVSKLINSLSSEAEIIFESNFGGTTRKSSGKRDMLISYFFTYKQAGTKFLEYRMTIDNVILSSDSKWVIKCIVFCIAQNSTTERIEHKSNQKLEVIIEKGYPVISKANIVQM
jgi:hypothetical protein